MNNVSFGEKMINIIDTESIQSRASFAKYVSHYLISSMILFWMGAASQDETMAHNEGAWFVNF